MKNIFSPFFDLLKCVLLEKVDDVRHVGGSLVTNKIL